MGGNAAVMQFPCDSYSEILKTTMNEFFNFQLRRCTSQTRRNTKHYIPSELVARLAHQPPKAGCEDPGRRSTHFTWVFCNLFLSEKGTCSANQAVDWSPATGLTQMEQGRVVSAAPSTPQSCQGHCTRARSAPQQEPRAGALTHSFSYPFNYPT